jgi:UDP-N-acetylmuramyl pentapeptide synthase
MSIRFLDLPALLGGTLLQAPAQAAPVTSLLLDSRRVGLTEGAVFFALRGPRHDGHHHLAALYAKGVRLFVVAYPPASLEPFVGAGFMQVADTLAALQALAAAHRATFAKPVWAITGSNGKTIVKEWLAQLLAPDEDICRSPKSYNSQVGVPLSVWELAPGRHTLGIFEAGISERGEMARLAQVIRPTHGIFTTLGTAHDAGFTSEGEKLGEKLQLFEQPGFKRLVYCADQPLVHAAVQARGLLALAWTRHDVPKCAFGSAKPTCCRPYPPSTSRRCWRRRASRCPLPTSLP